MRNYKRKTQRGTKSLEVMKKAAEEVVNNNKSLRSVAQTYDICRMSLKRFINRLNNNPDSPKFGYTAHRMVFTKNQETTLKDYLLAASDIYFGLGPKDVRRLAFECTVKFGIPCPESWKKKPHGWERLADIFFEKEHPALNPNTRGN